jgi:hypothetical protein
LAFVQKTQQWAEEEEEVWNGAVNQGADRARILVQTTSNCSVEGCEVLASGGRFVVAAEAPVWKMPGIYARVRPDIALISVSESDEAGGRRFRMSCGSTQRARIIVLIAPEASEQVVQFIQAGRRRSCPETPSTATILGRPAMSTRAAVRSTGDWPTCLFQGLAALQRRSLRAWLTASIRRSFAAQPARARYCKR